MSGFAAMLVKAAGWLDLAFAATHLAYWFAILRRRLTAHVEPGLLRVLDAINLQLALIFAGGGIVLLRFADDLPGLRAGREILLVGAFAWAIRTSLPTWPPTLDELVTGTRDHPWLHRILMGVFALGALVHLLPVILG